MNLVSLKNGLLAAALCLSSFATTSTDASERKFTYVYEVTTLEEGKVEYEQWATLKSDKESDSGFTRIDFRHEIEWGITDKLQAAIYYDWRYEDSKKRNDYSYMRDVALELIYNLSNPTTDTIGSAIYGEVAWGDDKFKLEGKLLLQKNIGKWIIGWNGIVEAEWEGTDYSETKGEFEQTLGASYQVNPKLSVGVELLHAVEYARWADWKEASVYIGPNVSYSQGKWWATITPMFQVTDNAGDADLQVRLLVGYNF